LARRRSGAGRSQTAHTQIKELLGAIPQHCYERSALRSGSYIVMDFAFIGACVYAATFINGLFGRDGSLVDGVAGQLARYAAWALYAFAAGLPGTGVWVIAHECGHQSFSESKFINNTVGWVLHSALLVPYHSWRISVRRRPSLCNSAELIAPHSTPSTTLPPAT
jgi:omega-6 fatty acid desaturase (delta-12 desaturase)